MTKVCIRNYEMAIVVMLGSVCYAHKGFQYVVNYHQLLSSIWWLKKIMLICARNQYNIVKQLSY